MKKGCSIFQCQFPHLIRMFETWLKTSETGWAIQLKQHTSPKNNGGWAQTWKLERWCSFPQTTPPLLFGCSGFLRSESDKQLHFMSKSHEVHLPRANPMQITQRFLVARHLVGKKHHHHHHHQLRLCSKFDATDPGNDSTLGNESWQQSEYYIVFLGHTLNCDYINLIWQSHQSNPHVVNSWHRPIVNDGGGAYPRNTLWKGIMSHHKQEHSNNSKPPTFNHQLSTTYSPKIICYIRPPNQYHHQSPTTSSVAW